MTTLKLAPNSVFWTLQGEGAQLGEPMCFVRLAGCSVGCALCDTNYTTNEELSVDDILARIHEVVPSSFRQAAQPWVWITGGEPTDQSIHPLIDGLRTLGYRVALATSGIRAVPVETAALLNWLSVSPHCAGKLEQWHGHEVKLVPGLGDLTWDNLPIAECGSFAWKYIQPMPTRTEQDRGIAWVLQHPGWRLSPQAHKNWRIA